MTNLSSCDYVVIFELINKNESAKKVLNKNVKAFIVQISSLAITIINSTTRKAQIFLILDKKVTIFAKYLDFVDVFSKKFLDLLLKYIEANKYMIKFGKKRDYFGSFYN